MPQQRRFTTEDRDRILGEWATSGLSGAKFAEISGTSSHTLYLWRRRARANVAASGAASSSAATESSRGAFAEVVLRPAAGHAHAPIEIAVGDAVVRIGAAFDDDQLRRVLDVLRAAG